MTPTAEDYAQAFEGERQKGYPTIDAFETMCGYAVDRTRLEAAARVLACPVKAHAPNWQHGRVLYAMTRQYLDGSAVSFMNVLDIGTAKGFSALCLQWALLDSGVSGRVVSVDVVDPFARVQRNSAAELDGLLTVPEFVALWREGAVMTFRHTGACDWPSLLHHDRIAVAFIDGKHTQEAVTKDAALVAKHQESGDVMVFDDLHLPGIAAAVADVRGYDVEHISILPNRAYAIATRC